MTTYTVFVDSEHAPPGLYQTGDLDKAMEIYTGWLSVFPHPDNQVYLLKHDHGTDELTQILPRNL